MYTKETLEALVEAGATPDLIQTGNEISFGMHWGFRDSDGQYHDYGQFSAKLEANSAWTAYKDTNWVQSVPTDCLWKHIPIRPWQNQTVPTCCASTSWKDCSKNS